MIPTTATVSAHERRGRSTDDPCTEAAADVVDVEALVHALEHNPRFRRDTPLGGIFHRGKISFREVSPIDSLHILIDGRRVSAHVDRVSPLNCNPRRDGHYSWLAIVAHNLADMTADLARRLNGHHGRHRCSLECEVVWIDEPAQPLAPAS